MLSFLPSIIILGSIAGISAVLANTRPSPVSKIAERNAAALALVVAIVAQGVHFTEEWQTGFEARFPELFGLEAIPDTLFVGFNLVWLGIWIVAVPGLRSGRRFAFFAAWFLAIAGVLNGVAHPLMAAAERGYFPGVVSSPLIFAAGVWLWVRLRKATQPKNTTLSPAWRP